ncbi:hypothetical protein MRB53_013002 [Persea americana]|uniref:Uncharacterized protein n=1 Tax=Persea americana TaxID=3435 RepID=A0ACC2LZ86_PERAE|nr:hypothetical protein MRB53_013002 [Persea americana]
MQRYFCCYHDGAPKLKRIRGPKQRERCYIENGARLLKELISSCDGKENPIRIYTFVVERGSFTFEESDLRDFPMTADIAMKLEWAIGRDSCSNVSSNICGQNSFCVESIGGLGHLCNCSDGYVGNPYLNGSKGCQDADECLDPEIGPCVPVAHCQNEVPGYKCICPFGSTGDGKRHGSGCRKILQVIEAVLGTCLGFAVMLLCVGENEAENEQLVVNSDALTNVDCQNFSQASFDGNL